MGGGPNAAECCPLASPRSGLLLGGHGPDRSSFARTLSHELRRPAVAGIVRCAGARIRALRRRPLSRR